MGNKSQNIKMNTIIGDWKIIDIPVESSLFHVIEKSFETPKHNGAAFI